MPISIADPANNSTVATSFVATGDTTTEAITSAQITVNGTTYHGTITAPGPLKWSASFSGVGTGTGAKFEVAGAAGGANGTAGITVQ